MIGHRVVLRSRSFFEVADLSLVFMRDHARLYAMLLPWVLVPAALATWCHMAEGWSVWSAITVEVLVLGFAQGVFTQLCGDLMLTDQVRLRTVQAQFLRRSVAWLWANVVGWIVTAPLITYRAVTFAPEGVFLERGRLAATMSRHAALIGVTPGRAGAFGLFSMAVCFAGATGMELVRLALRELFALQIDLEAEQALRLTWAPFVGLALVQPFLATLRFLLYIDCRTRREGWDLQRELAALAGAEPAVGRAA